MAWDDQLENETIMLLSFKCARDVFRQFGYEQGILEEAVDHRKFRIRVEQFRKEDGWNLIRLHIDFWNGVMDLVVEKIPFSTDVKSLSEYMVWYKKITQRHVHRPRAEGDTNKKYEHITPNEP